METNENNSQQKLPTKEELFGKVLDKMYETYKKKNLDYTSGNKSSFEQSYERFGLTSVAIRLNDKVNRICAFAEKGEYYVDDEKVIDTLLDNAVYSVLAIVEEQYKRIVKQS